MTLLTFGPGKVWRTVRPKTKTQDKIVQKHQEMLERNMVSLYSLCEQGDTKETKDLVPSFDFNLKMKCDKCDIEQLISQL